MSPATRRGTEFRPQKEAVAGQALVEYALLVPLLFLLIINAVNFGGFIFAWITVANAARAGAQYAVLGGASAGAPLTPSAAQVVALITTDISSLLNGASLTVSVCTNNNGVVRSVTGTCASPPIDPESPFFLSATVDVTYTYQPFLPLNFSVFGVRVTLPPTRIHRRAVMRMMQ